METSPMPYSLGKSSVDLNICSEPNWSLTSTWRHKQTSSQRQSGFNSNERVRGERLEADLLQRPVSIDLAMLHETWRERLRRSAHSGHSPPLEEDHVQNGST